MADEGQVEPIRKPGNRKGMPRPEGAGRKRGTPNRVTADLRAAAQRYTKRSLTTLARLLVDPNPDVRLKAASALLDRAHGKPMTPTELTGKDGAPLGAPGETDDFAAARLIAFMLTKAAKEQDAAAPAPPKPAPAIRRPVPPVPVEAAPAPEPEAPPAPNVVTFPEARPQQAITPMIFQRDRA